jgi:hypothetical protein
MDLQTLVVQLPKLQRDRMTATRPEASSTSTSDYPVALVPGQYSEYYRKYTPTELA